jgi:hypothetical protein
MSTQTIFAADVHLAEVQFLCEETAEKKGKSLKFRIATRMPTVSSEESQVKIKIKIRIKKQRDYATLYSSKLSSSYSPP